ncbi:MAG TPA: metal-sensitive transcriptional regulator [Microbacteriaceae bacterium]|nr:metal-sensitive transcriptional regulator [Microbacteriaceae bacterium]
MSESREREEAQKRVLNRLRRASGQLNAVIAKVEEGGNCRDVITQLAAVSSALDRAGFAIISTAMQECFATGDGPHGESVDDLEKLFTMLA